jgi:hypothetical protein
MNTQLELEVIKKFVRKEKQSRFIQFILSSKNRKKFLNELPHFKDFKLELFEEVRVNERKIIFNKLKSLKGNQDTCYVISENSTIDQKQITIEEAISFLSSGFATILVFGQAEMIYYEGEPPNNKSISKL